MQVLLRNPSSGVTVLTPNPEKPESYIRFEGTGDKMGGDMQYVARATAELPATIKAVQRGLLVAEGLGSDDELAGLLVARREAESQSPQALTVEELVWDEKGESTSTALTVVIEPLQKY